ncbi:ubiquitin-protein ligase E3A [Planoprotostelium fungivorum]|uniref:HECT-type E3 ubiquitin transferase n=1 Tax=Planoprotostelium fungivorum TaxID=1890364 RepID=A0A2P6NQB7_9EUKA|nr:ubiquitin-protein ligase E3A [Planoprotostelium fungivorum]
MSELLKRNIQTYFVQLTQGCGRPGCTNPNCASNPTASKQDQPTAIKTAFALATKNDVSNLCASFPANGPVPSTPTPSAPPPKPSPVKAEVPFIRNYEEFLSVVQAARETNVFTAVVRLVGSVFGDPESLSKSFRSPDPNMELSYDINQEDLEKTYELIRQLPENVQNSFRYALERAALLTKAPGAPSTSTIRIYIMLLNCPIVTEEEQFQTILAPLIVAMASTQAREGMMDYWRGLSREKFRWAVDLIQNFITKRSRSTNGPINSDNFLTSAARVIQPLFEINEEMKMFDFSVFYNEALSERAEVIDDYRNWKDSSRGFSFCNYSFLLTPFYKSQLLYIESKVEQRSRRAQAIGQYYMGVDTIPFLGIRVKRESVVQDTLYELGQYPTEDLRKELRVHFVGEEGVDEGGVKKELFQLIVKEIFDPKFGMFIHNSETGAYWFNPNSTDFAEFQLIGTLLGLAIYNNVILEVHFPKFMYKKMYNVKADLEDIKSYDPSLYQGFRKLLEYSEGDVEDIFGLTFQVTYKNEFGENATFDLKENGEQIPVTNENREEYVRLYMEYLTETSVKQQYDRFYKGFSTLCSSPAFHLFRMEEIELLICGVSTLNFHELEKVTHYEGYTKDSDVIRNFWEVIHSLSEEQKKKFLSFTTGCDRAPIGGLQNMRFSITRAGEDSDRLPSAHTCFNHLLLPEYSTKEKLKERLVTAIGNSEGFGML